MTEQQPMKMAAAEAIWDTQAPASFSVFTIGTPDGESELFSVRVPYLLSFMATGDPNGEVEGINDVQRESEEQFGPGDYRPIIPVTYWSFRYMIGFGIVTAALAAARAVHDARWAEPGREEVVLPRRAVDDPVPADRQLLRLDLHRDGPPAVGGLQPDVHPRRGLPPGRARLVATSLIVLTLLYLALAIVEVGLIVRYVKAGPPENEAERGADRAARA